MLSVWFAEIYGSEPWPVEEYDALNHTITVGAAKPTDLDIYHETDGVVWSIIWMQ